MARFKPVSEEVAAPTTSGAAITVSDANVVRIVNTASSTPYLVTLLDDADNTFGTLTVLGSQEVFLDKPKSYKVFAANAAIKLTSVTYPI